VFNTFVSKPLLVPVGQYIGIKAPKSYRFATIDIKCVALETCSNTFQVVLNFVNFGITGTKNTPAQYIRFKIFKNKNTVIIVTIM
jgi:hypothetical protein